MVCIAYVKCVARLSHYGDAASAASAAMLAVLYYDKLLQLYRHEKNKTK